MAESTDDTKIRQFCIDMAVRTTGAGLGNVIQTAQSYYEFITAGQSGGQESEE